MAITYEPIITTTLANDAASIILGTTGTGTIPNTYTDLVLVLNTRLNNNNYTSSELRIQVGNGSIDTGSNYSYTRLIAYKVGSDASQTTGQTNISVGTIPDSGGGTNWGTAIMNFMDYSNTTTFKNVFSRTNDANDWVAMSIGMWNSTSAINQIKIYTIQETFFAGTTATLYGIAAA